jgi:hypothetical protein
MDNKSLQTIYVETFKMDVIIFIGIKRHNVTSPWPILTKIRVTKLTLTISLCEIKEQMSNLQIVANDVYTRETRDYSYKPGYLMFF